MIDKWKALLNKRFVESKADELDLNSVKSIQLAKGSGICVNESTILHYNLMELVEKGDVKFDIGPHYMPYITCFQVVSGSVIVNVVDD